MTVPTAYVAIAKREAARWGSAYGVTVPAALVLAIMTTENRTYNTRASNTEPDGELSRGLMQVKDSTARWLGLAQPVRLFEPAIGISYGTKYLAFQLKRYGGDPERAAAAYNAGTARRSSSGAWINQGYVASVLGYLEQFRRALASSALPTAAALVLAALALRWYLSRRRRLVA